jgi:hypothetical protein
LDKRLVASQNPWPS